MAKMSIDVSPQIAAVARPGDTVVITLADRITDEEYAVLGEQWRQHVGESIHLAIMDGATGLLVVKGPELDVNGAPLVGHDDEEFEKEFPR